MNPSRANPLPPLMLFLAACCWGLSIPIMKALGIEQNLLAAQIGTIPGSVASLAVRFGSAALAIALMARISPMRILRIEWVNGSILGIITAISMGLQVDGLNYTDASTAGFLIALYSVFIPLILWVSGRRAMSLILGFCCILVIAGMVILMDIDPRSISLGRGEWESLAAAFLFACQILWVDRLKQGSFVPERMTLVLCGSVAGFCLVALVFLPGGLAVIPATHASPRAGLLTALLALLGTAFPFLVMNRFQSRVNPVTAGFLYCFEPIATALGAMFLPELLVRNASLYANETFSLRLALGGGLVLAANLFLLRDPVKTETEPR